MMKMTMAEVTEYLIDSQISVVSKVKVREVKMLKNQLQCRALTVSNLMKKLKKLKRQETLLVMLKRGIKKK
jgi:hypothetical protein